ncbi:MAG: hypothetical protein C4583_05475 [Anaerolineaceae bacterium]|nr:MAG: hypothetical protein C4583_05475 [Anaerolineaceae bacterium]
MEISLAKERAFHLVPRTTLEIAQIRVDEKRTNLVAGMVGSLISRPKPEEIKHISSENRLEAFWFVSISARTVYDRNKSYSVAVGGSEVQRVTVLGREVAVDAKSKSFLLNGVEHCADERRVSSTFDGTSGQKNDFSKYLTFEKLEIPEADKFMPEGILVVPPQMRATAVVRQVMAEVVKPVQAQTILEERVDVEAIDLFFRPVYAFEYEWSAKNKRAVIEFDALTGDIRTDGKKLGDQIKSIWTRDLLFDLTADAVGMVVPGGSIAVKLVKAVVDRKK